VTFDHNTVISPDGSGIILADGDPIAGFVFTNNVARHNSYGIFGSGSSVGNKTLATYFPNSLVTRNVMAEGSAAAYPSGNEFPSIADFQAHFVDYAAGNYALVPNTSWQASATDGLDLGADLSRIAGAGSLAGAPLPPDPVAAPLTIQTAMMPATAEGSEYSSSLAASGGVAPISWSIASGMLPAGLLLDMTSGLITGTAVTAGDYVFTVQARDQAGTTTSRALSIHVERATPQLSITTSTLNTVTATLPFSQALTASGGSGTYRWSVAGALPAGLTLSSAGVLAGTTSSAGTYPVTVTVVDGQEASRSASQPYSLYVAPPANHPPTVTLSAPATNTVVPVGSTLTITATAADVDGNLSRIDLYAGSILVASNSGPTISVPWMVATAGSYQFSAVATDIWGQTAVTQPVTIATRSEIVLYASDVKTIAGNYQLVTEPTAAGGVMLWNPDLAVAKLAAAAATPVSYAEFTFLRGGRAPLSPVDPGARAEEQLGQRLCVSPVLERVVGTDRDHRFDDLQPRGGIGCWRVCLGVAGQRLGHERHGHEHYLRNDGTPDAARPAA
jgi:hypothetical protein